MKQQRQRGDRETRTGFQGYWSRRVTDEHRIVYEIVEDEIRIAACRYRYTR
ncbi:type II toxin-antitoxin system YoeB family toxin [Pseudonocardia sp. MH-G8]|uniref:type II toxin-antitoxin system YoeB family toxin n=1 Tax=Pseudonocardia sp. MH-G8 TaxID=1854588 RepID=UPI0026C0695E|nr:type II toxin-antitoxin system YoeB family toxin [Pseudonocardia sp. MH-G8]